MGHRDVWHIFEVFNRFKRTGVQDVVERSQLRQPACHGHFDDPGTLEQVYSPQLGFERLKAADDVTALLDGLNLVDYSGRRGRIVM